MSLLFVPLPHPLNFQKSSILLSRVFSHSILVVEDTNRASRSWGASPILMIFFHDLDPDLNSRQSCAPRFLENQWCTQESEEKIDPTQSNTIFWSYEPAHIVQSWERDLTPKDLQGNIDWKQHVPQRQQPVGKSGKINRLINGDSQYCLWSIMRIP